MTVGMRGAFLGRRAPASGAASPHTEEYAYSGAAEEYTVQSGETSVVFKIWGGAGGAGFYSSVHSGSWSGAGAYVTGTIAVTAGDVIKVEVGQGGRGRRTTDNGGEGGWPDGGGGANGDANMGGGGGSTRVYKNGTLYAVAGAGGGSGYGPEGKAGAGGYPSGQDAESATGGEGGSQTAGGRDKNDTGNANKTGRSIVSFPGVQRTGGWGSSVGDTTTSTGDDGGGGGGGYWGGGGGGGDAVPGGGGSSWTHASVTSVTHNSGAREVQSVTTGAPAGTAQGKDSDNSAESNHHGGDGYAILEVS